MVKLVWSESAIEDLRSIHDYVALDSPKNAKQFTTRLIERIDQLANFPRSGRVVPEFNKQDIRELIEGQYRIFYMVFADRILIARILSNEQLLIIDKSREEIASGNSLTNEQSNRATEQWLNDK